MLSVIVCLSTFSESRAWHFFLEELGFSKKNKSYPKTSRDFFSTYFQYFLRCFQHFPVPVPECVLSLEKELGSVQSFKWTFLFFLWFEFKEFLRRFCHVLFLITFSTDWTIPLHLEQLFSTAYIKYKLSIPDCLLLVCEESENKWMTDKDLNYGIRLHSYFYFEMWTQDRVFWFGPLLQVIVLYL